MQIKEKYGGLRWYDNGFPKEGYEEYKDWLYKYEDLSFKTTHAYNINKNFHPFENNWVGYILNIDNHNIFILGDTDNNPDIKNVKCDIALVPIGGTFTMNYIEASEYINNLKPSLVIPTHYGLIVGDKNDGKNILV